MGRKFEVVVDVHRKHPEVKVKKPIRATKNAAGYDFFANETAIILPGDSHLFVTDIRATMEPDEFLLIVPRSSIGTKRNLKLKNTVGIIDQDFYKNIDNDGNIMVNYYNYGKLAVTITMGEAFAQGIFLKDLLTDDDHLTEKQVRVGGVGSTDKSGE